MKLLVPLALWGLLTIPIILLFHLLHSRREQQFVSSLRLWTGLEQRRQGGRPRTIPLSWLLVLQIIAAAALALSLAQPVQSFLRPRAQYTIFILDTTTSMTTEDAPVPNGFGQIRRFEAARQFISRRLKTIATDDAFALISLNDTPQILQQGRGEDKATALLELDNLVPGATGLKLDTALTLANGLIAADSSRTATIIIITDGTFTLPNVPLPPTLAPVTWQFVPADPPATANQALLNVSAARLPDGRHRLFARFINYSDETVTRTVQLTMPAAPDINTSLTLPPQGEAVRAWTLPAAAQTVSLEIVETDSLPLDNRAELLLTGLDDRHILLISSQPDLLRRAIEAQPGATLTVAARWPIQNPADFDLIIFDGLPPTLNAWPSGSVLVVNPQMGHSMLEVIDFSSDLRRPNLDPKFAENLLTGVDLSGVYFNHISQITVPAWAKINLESLPPTPLPLIFQGSVDNSRVMVWAFDPAQSNLPERLALPLLTANMLTALTRPLLPETVAVGQAITLNQTLSVELPGGRMLTPPEENLGDYQFHQTHQPGLYRVYHQDGRIAGGFAVHAGSVDEANVGHRIDPAARKLIEMELSTAPEAAQRELWPWLAGLALAVISAEGWLAWRK